MDKKLYIRQIPLLVSSFDAYSACWAPFCHGVQKYWPECAESLIFITNQKTSPCGTAVQTGADRGWAANLKFALSQIDAPYLLYAQEDYWINKRVNHQNILDYLALIDDDKADCIRLYPAPGPGLPCKFDDRLGIQADNAEYRASLQMAIWRKSVLEDLLIEGESPWRFEAEGSVRSRRYGARFLCVNKRRYGVEYVFTAIIQGEWTKQAREYAASEGITVDWDTLPKKPWQKRAKYRVKARLYRAAKRWRKRRAT